MAQQLTIAEKLTHPATGETKIKAISMIEGIFGVDTVKGSIALNQPLPEAVFSRRHEILTGRGLIVKLSTKNDGHEPRVTYYPRDFRLLYEVSLPYFLTGQNIHPVDENWALEAVNIWIQDKFGDVPHVGDWNCTKIDYFASFKVGSDLDDYLRVFQSCEIPRYERISYQHGGGIVWKAKTRHINLYSKFAECGEEDARGHLRIEVSNRKDAVKYMARRWLGDKGRTIACLCSEENAYHVVAHFLDLLDAPNLQALRQDVGDFKRLFPNSWASAITYRDLIRERGSASWRSGLMSRSTYYRYRKALLEAGLMTPSNCVLEPLRLVAPKKMEVLQHATGFE